MQGLLGTQPQAQQQGNLLGNLFQTPQQARNQSRNRLFQDAIAISQTPGAGASIAGGLLGEAAGRAMGRVTPEEDRAMQLQGLQGRLAEQGLDPSQDPYGFFTGLASELNNMGMQGEAVQAMMQAREFAPESVATERVVSGDSQIGQDLGLGSGETAIATVENGNVTGLKDRTQAEEDDLSVNSQARFRNKNTGETLTLVRTNKGLARQTVDAQGEPEFEYVNSANFEQVGAAETADVGSFSDNFGDVANRRNITLNFVNEAKTLADQITPETLGIPGAISTGLSSLRSQAIGAIRATTGLDFTAPTDVDSYNAAFEDLGLADASGTVKSNLLSLGILKAYADQGGTGEIRQNEVVRGLQSIRAGSGDPGQIKAALGQLSRTFIDRYNTALETAQQGAGGVQVPYEPLDPTEYELTPDSATPTPRQLTEEAVQQLSLEEIQQLDESLLPNDPMVLQALSDRIDQLLEGGANDRSNRSRGGGAR